jgi:hypothetical protein
VISHWVANRQDQEAAFMVDYLKIDPEHLLGAASRASTGGRAAPPTKEPGSLGDKLTQMSKGSQPGRGQARQRAWRSRGREPRAPGGSPDSTRWM